MWASTINDPSVIFFHYNEIGHISVRCPKKKNYRGSDKYKGRKNEDRKDYKDKGKKCYIVEEDDSNEHDDEVVYVAMKDKFGECIQILTP